MRTLAVSIVVVLVSAVVAFTQPAELPPKETDAGRSSDAMRHGLEPEPTPTAGLAPGMLGGSTTTAETGGGKTGASGAASRMGGASSTTGTSSPATEPTP
jgi:hypothetical protein